MKIKWLGHASFLITSDSGTKIITDPYHAGGNLSYGEIKESAHLVTISHNHGDHNNVDNIEKLPKTEVPGKPIIVRGPLPPNLEHLAGIPIKALPTYHDNAGGKQRGTNNIFCLDVDGMRVCHLGDLGHPLGDKQAAELGKIDVLFVPVGGNFTIDAKAATEVAKKLKAKVVIPMHYKNDRCLSFPVASVDEFLAGKKNVTKMDSSEVEFKKSTLPTAATIIVLKPAL